jgi:hypothetical protein
MIRQRQSDALCNICCVSGLLNFADIFFYAKTTCLPAFAIPHVLRTEPVASNMDHMFATVPEEQHFARQNLFSHSLIII